MTGDLLAVLLAFLLVGVSVRVFSDYRQKKQLLQWLNDPEQNELPDGSNLWRSIFTAQQGLKRAHEKDLVSFSQQLERYVLATSVLPDGVILLDGNNRIEWVNATGVEQLGIDPDRDMGTLISQLVRQPAFHHYLVDFRAGKPLPENGVTVTSSHTSRTLQLRLLSFSAEGTLLLSRDITTVVRTEQMRRDFVSNVSHELRTPATVISGFLEQLTSDEPPTGEAATHFLNLMSDQARRMNRLIEDLLMLSRLESDIQAPRQDVVDVPVMIDDLLNEARALSNGRHSIVCDSVEPIRITGNVDELRSAFSNLISNAVRYTPEGGTITVSWTENSGQLEFAVIDTGIGIAPEHIPRLTERFYRVDRGRSTATGGTGLGLAIVKHALSRHQAKLQVHSTLGRGSRFVACFPTTARLA